MNPKKAAYNRVYNRTTFGLGRGCVLMIAATLLPVLALSGAWWWASASS